jgi:hypothetical protein
MSANSPLVLWIVIILFCACTAVTADLLPGWGPVTGRTTVTVFGSKFRSTPYLSCSFGSVKGVRATFINSSALACISPPYLTVGYVPLEVSLNNQDYTSNGRQYWYQGMYWVDEHYFRVIPRNL